MAYPTTCGQPTGPKLCTSWAASGGAEVECRPGCKGAATCYTGIARGGATPLGCARVSAGANGGCSELTTALGVTYVLGVCATLQLGGNVGCPCWVEIEGGAATGNCCATAPYPNCPLLRSNCAKINSPGCGAGAASRNCTSSSRCPAYQDGGGGSATWGDGAPRALPRVPPSGTRAILSNPGGAVPTDDATVDGYPK